MSHQTSERPDHLIAVFIGVHPRQHHGNITSNTPSPRYGPNQPLSCPSGTLPICASSTVGLPQPPWPASPSPTSAVEPLRTSRGCRRYVGPPSPSSLAARFANRQAVKLVFDIMGFVQRGVASSPSLAHEIGIVGAISAFPFVSAGNTPVPQCRHGQFVTTIIHQCRAHQAERRPLP